MFLEKLKSLNKTNIATIFKGNFISKFVLIIGGLFLAKFYGANDYGEFSIYLSIAMITSILLSFGVEHLIILTTKKRLLSHYFNGGNLLGFLFLMLILGIISFLKIHFISQKALYLGIISGFFILYANNAKLLLSKVNQFKFISLLTMCDAVVSFLMQCFFLYLKLENGLIWGSFVGFFSAFLLALILAKKWIQKPNFIIFFQGLKERKDLVKLVYPSTLLNTLGNQMMPILMGLFFVSEIVGEYALAIKILSVPLLMISSSIAVVYYPKAVEIFENQPRKKLFDYTRKMSGYNFLIIFVLFILLNTVGIYLLKFIFNKVWVHFPIFVFWLSFGFLARSLINPIADILTILKKNHWSLYFNIYLFFINFLVIFIGKNYGFYVLVGSFSLLLFLGYSVLYLCINFYLEKK